MAMTGRRDQIDHGGVKPLTCNQALQNDIDGDL